MVASFIVLFVCLFLLLAWAIFMVCKTSEKKGRCKCDQSDLLERNVSGLMRLIEQLKVIEELQHEKACKDELMEEIHSMFFFEELKNPEDILQEFSKKAEAFANNADKEDEKIAEMYKAIVEREKSNRKSVDI